MLKNFLESDGDHIIFTGEYMEAYIPEYYFDSKHAEDYGITIQVFGIFNVRTFAKDKPGELETFNIPSLIHIHPAEVEKKELQLIPGDDDEVLAYRVAKFYKGNKVMTNSIPQDSSNVELFINLLFRGNIPPTIPYDQIIKIWLKNLDLNNVKLGVTSTIMEIIVTEIYRNKNKPEETFSKVIGNNPKTSPYAYRTANIREICARNSTFAALTFEDVDAMLTSALNINKYDRQESESPIEKIIKM